MNLHIFQKQHDAAGRNPLLASASLREALERLRPCPARELENLVRAGRIVEAIGLAETITIEGGA